MCLCGGMGWWFRVFWKDGTRVAVICMMSNCSTMNLWLLSTGQRPPLGGEGVICDKISGGKRMYIAKITKSQTPQTTNPNHHLSPTWLSDFVYLYYIWTSSNLPEFKLYKCVYIYIHTHIPCIIIIAHPLIFWVCQLWSSFHFYRWNERMFDVFEATNQSLVIWYC